MFGERKAQQLSTLGLRPSQTSSELGEVQSTGILDAASARRGLKVAAIICLALGALGGVAACLTTPLGGLKSFRGDSEHAVAFSELPAGWAEFVDSQGRTYYHHARSGKNQWER